MFAYRGLLFDQSHKYGFMCVYGYDFRLGAWFWYDFRLVFGDVGASMVRGILGFRLFWDTL